MRLPTTAIKLLVAFRSGGWQGGRRGYKQGCGDTRQQVFEKGNERIGVLMTDDEVTDLNGRPVERAKDMAIQGCYAQNITIHIMWPIRRMN